MTSELTASEVRYDLAVTELAYSRLARHPALQAEAIAKHYVSHALLALEVLKLIELRDNGGDAYITNQLIERLSDQIKANHRYDLGIQLKWEKPPERTNDN